jgi:hypothetical protein
MPEITLSEAEYERLQEIRNELQEAFIGAYGTVRTEDTIAYLLDTYTPPDERGQSEAYEQLAEADYPQLQHVATNLSSVPGSGIGANEMRGRLVTELDPAELVAQLNATQDEGAGETDAEKTSTDESNDAGENSDEDQTDSDERLGGETAGSEGSPEAALRTAANQLLAEHDDKWRESDGEAPYEVDLPDGTTTTARTKDDVRQQLYQNY